MTLTRRRFLASAGAAALVLPACGGGVNRNPIQPDDPAVAARESRLAGPGAKEISRSIVAGPVELDLAGSVRKTWGFTGDPIRASAGDILAVELQNDLPEHTAIHWHGIAIRNDMDGVHDLTQQAVESGGRFTHRFAVPDPGTYFFHPHTGLQLDRALYAPLIIEDPAESGAYDVEHVVVLDDWLEGTPEEAFAGLGMGDMDMGDMDMGDMDMGEGSMGTSELLGGHAGDVAYGVHLINQRPPADRETFDVPVGATARLRIINAGSDTAYRFAIGGHRLTVTHADGFPVEPVEVDAILLGMGERYDVTVRALAGAFPMVALAEGKNQHAAAVLRSGGGDAPEAGVRPVELDGRILRYADLVPSDAARLATREPDVTHDLDLTGDEADYAWGINGAMLDDADPFDIETGQRVQLRFRNTSTMWHPMHLHGHTFAATNGARKDTIIVLPDEEVSVVFDADNPGQWMVHCHNTYHLEAGMAGVISYVEAK